MIWASLFQKHKREAMSIYKAGGQGTVLLKKPIKRGIGNKVVQSYVHTMTNKDNLSVK
jgi:hypothetical protein